MILRWILFFWALITTVVMLAIGLSAIISGIQVSGDNSIIFGFTALAGIPAWLILAALTITNWRSTKKSIIVLHNSPAFLSAIIYIMVSMQWAK